MFSGNEWLILMIGLVPIALIVILVVFLVTRTSSSGGATNQPTGYGAGTTTPAGWFPDPAQRHQHRYWDGMRWTEHVSDNGRPGIDQP